MPRWPSYTLPRAWQEEKSTGRWASPTRRDPSQGVAKEVIDEVADEAVGEAAAEQGIERVRHPVEEPRRETPGWRDGLDKVAARRAGADRHLLAARVALGALVVSWLVLLSACGSSTAGGGSPSAASSTAPVARPELRGRRYPLHTGIVATTFWVGELFDPAAPDGSQVVSTYDSEWLEHYGGCDGVLAAGRCETERRTVGNGYFPTRMIPRENPFYLDLPFDDVNDPAAFARRAEVVPWAHDPGYAGRAADPSFSYMKNRWVKLMRGGRTCYGQIEDAGPGEYDDYRYVFGSDDRRPRNIKFNGAGLDVSPALNGCLGFSAVNGSDDRVDWQFVDDVDVPPGPWTTIVTTRGVVNH